MTYRSQKLAENSCKEKIITVNDQNTAKNDSRNQNFSKNSGIEQLYLLFHEFRKDRGI